ncbi:hypothetical protein Dimus_019705 [Dionaea muscipula]
MSFLARRLAEKEGAYFLQESKQSVARLAEKKTAIVSPSPPSPPPPSAFADSQTADILPEVLRHSLPSKILCHQSTSNTSSLSASSRWAIQSPQNDSVSPVSGDALNPLRGYLSMPQVTFGPKRWQLPQAGGSVTASTANELRREQYTQVNPEKLKAAAEGLAQIGKAFAAATAITFGGAALTFGLVASKLDIHNGDDIRTKGREIVQPKFKAFQERLNPLRNWAKDVSNKWHIKVEHDVKEKPIIKELSKNIGARS